MIAEMAIQPDKYGFWTHPEFFKPVDESRIPGPNEFADWLEQNNLTCHMQSLKGDHAAQEISARQKEDGDYDISAWHPAPPEGEGWFIGSIHNTQDGPYCIWLCKKS